MRDAKQHQKEIEMRQLDGVVDQRLKSSIVQILDHCVLEEDDLE
eukprot:COSAG04_NODE_11144_length_728_cov_0.807631_2_plen_43_part_01